MVVTNAYGTVTSSNALLTVVPAGTNCLPAPAGLVSWWRGGCGQLGGHRGLRGTRLRLATIEPLFDVLVANCLGLAPVEAFEALGKLELEVDFGQKGFGRKTAGQICQ